jgi:hypothetical protein
MEDAVRIPTTDRPVPDRLHFDHVADVASLVGPRTGGVFRRRLVPPP